MWTSLFTLICFRRFNKPYISNNWDLTPIPGVITGNTARGAGVGAVAGGARGVGSTNKERSRVVKNCLRNRGYQILN